MEYIQFFFAGSMFFFTLLFIAVMVVAMWKIFTKAGQPGWASIVPIYNIMVLLQITRLPLWIIVAFFIPLVNALAAIYVTWKLGEVFGKGEGFRIGMIILPFIFYPILGFGSARYQGSETVVASEPQL